MSMTGNAEQTQTGIQYAEQRADDVNNEQGKTVHETVLYTERNTERQIDKQNKKPRKHIKQFKR